MDELTPREALLKEAYDAAPPYIQDFIVSGKFDAFMAELQGKLTIHADIANGVSNEILMMILGLTEPKEFVESLVKHAGVDPKLVGPIVEETNKAVFIPLQEQTRAQRVTDTPPATPRPTPPPSAYVPPAPPAPEPIPVPTPPIQEIPIVPSMRTMASDVEQINGGGVPAARPYTIPGSAPTPPPAPVSAPVPPPAPITASIPAPSAPVPAPVAPIVPHRERSVPAPSREEVTDTLKKYGIDPYREPVE
jgi:hypothetical protein